MRNPWVWIALAAAAGVGWWWWKRRNALPPLEGGQLASSGPI